MAIQESIIISLVILATNQSFQKRHKSKPTAFTRKRKLSFTCVVGMLLRMVKSSTQICCNWLGDMIEKEPASKQAFSQARQQISEECFKEFHEDGLRVNYKLTGEKGLWKGFRLIGADSSLIRLPESVELEKAFGRWPSREQQNPSPPMARISEFVDMTSKLVLSGRLVPCTASEEQLASEQLTEVVEKMRRYGQSKMLFVYDRGYPSKQLIEEHLKLGVDFLFRVPKNFNKAIKEIYASKESESHVVSCDLPLLRVSQFVLPSGEEELLLTSLIDTDLFPQEDLSAVYHGRWTALEEGYKRQKVTMQLDNFSGKTERAIRQEYWATVVVANIIEAGCIEIEGYWIPQNLPEKQVNRSVLFGSMRDATIEVIFGEISGKEYSTKFKTMAKRSMMKVRPGRSYSRDSLKKPRRPHIYRRSC